MTKNGNQLYEKTTKFNCLLCNFKCSHSSDWNRHILTTKHQMVTNDKQLPIISHTCLCGSSYKHSSGLSRHKKSCNSIITTTTVANETSELKYLVLEMVKTNTELQKQILELCKNTTTTNNTNNNTVNNNSHNKTFNLQFFLNDTCKNAMNLTDFVSSLQIDLSDLESVGELGFVNGISNLIINGLNDLEECERPVHCSDLKRESMYVKDDNKWVKEDAENTKMKKALKQIAHKNIKMLPVWKAKNPDCKRSESHLSDKYSHMVIEAMGGSGDNDEEKANKIIRKIAKEVTIKKQF
jgi:hypothetical protein